MTRRAFALSAPLVAGCRTARQQLQPVVRIALGSRAAFDFIPVYLAAALGFFRVEGLNVALQDVASTSKAVEALLGGSADAITGGYDATIQMSIESKSIESIAVFERWPPYALVVAPQFASSIHAIGDLKGHFVGVSSPGSSSHRLLNYFLVRNGLSPSDSGRNRRRFFDGRRGSPRQSRRSRGEHASAGAALKGVFAGGFG